MTEKLEQTIKEGLISLPIELQNAINSSNWDKIAEEVGRKFYLSNDEINNLQLETGLVLLGYKKLDLFAINIELSTPIDGDSSVKISDELDKRIFTPIEQIIEKSVENNLDHINTNWKQRINFIVSGGDYSVFIEEINNPNI